MADEITRAIARRTDSLVLERLLRERGLWDMALEMKGLKANMASLAQRVERLNAKAVAANEKGGELESHLDDIEGQFGQHVGDIVFTATMLGNSGASSDAIPKPEPFPEPGVGDGTTDK